MTTDKQELSELLPCPFCGANGEHDQDREYHPHGIEPSHRIRCSSGDCPCPTPFAYLFKSPKYAAIAWNTRPAKAEDNKGEALEK